MATKQTTKTTNSIPPVPVSAKAVKTAKATKPSVFPQTPKAKRSRKPHPAEAAGMKVHQTVEAGVGYVSGAVYTGVDYAWNFVKGVIKGH